VAELLVKYYFHLYDAKLARYFCCHRVRFLTFPWFRVQVRRPIYRCVYSDAWGWEHSLGRNSLPTTSNGGREVSYSWRCDKILSVSKYKEQYFLPMQSCNHKNVEFQHQFKIHPSFTNPRWRTVAILKNEKMAISQQLFDRSARNLARDACRPSEQYWQLKVPTFKSLRWRTAAILKKIEKSPYLGNGLTNLKN